MAKKQTDGGYGAAAHRAITRAQRAAGRDGSPELYIAMANAYAMMDLADSIRERRAAVVPEGADGASDASSPVSDAEQVGDEAPGDEAASDHAADDATSAADARGDETPAANAAGD